MIYPQTASLLESFSQEPLLEEHKTILIGGTAMAYHINHLDRNKIRDMYDIVYLLENNSYGFRSMGV
ncbi:MAG: hypothetical protein DRG30_09345 [Epsilonproteobacteria bacterium]|nr:MAG: hypothetical protein DRG30_09345 [Campylobacterota bacterium]